MEYDIFSAQTPEWVTILILILGALGTFWTKIKSTFEQILSSKETTVKSAKQTLVKRIQNLEKSEKELQDKQLQLIKANTALTTAVNFLILEIERTNPDSKTTIIQVKKIIQEAVINGELSVA